MEIPQGERLEPGPSSSVPPSSQRSTPSITPSTAPSSRHPPASAVVSTPSAPAQPATLAKRLLFPHLAADSSIPPLLRSSNIPPALDAELYDFIALTLRAFVNPWWTKLTRYDKDFLPHITHITTHVVRVFEERLQSADLSSLVFREIPLILNQHFLDYRVAAAKKGSAYAAGGQYGIASIFHSQQQHIGVTADGRLDEIYVRTALDSVLKICLPREDWTPETERHIVREVILMVICKNIAPKLTQGWFIQKMVLDLMGREESIVSSPPDPSTPPPEPLQFNAPSVHTLLVFFLSTVQTVSSIGLAIVNAYKHALHIVKLVNDSPYGKIPSDSSTRQPVSPTLEQTPLQGSRIFRAVNLSQTSSSTSSASSAYATSQPASIQPPWYSPGYAFPPLVLVTSALSLSSRFLPSALLLLLSMGTSFFSHFLDRLLPYALYTYVLAPQQLIGIVANAKRSLFPNGYPAQAPPDPTLEEQLVIRSKLISRIDSKLSPAVASALLGPPAVRLQTISDLIDPLSNAACNTHLFILILDAIILTLFPELGVGGTEHE